MNIIIKNSNVLEIKHEMKTINKEMKLIYRKCNETSKYKYRRIQNAFWLSSFIAIFMPCCYTKPLEITTITIIEHNTKLLRKLGIYLFY